MKRVIILFGESGSGKKTLIENILSNKDNIREDLGLEDKKITVVRETIEEYNGRIIDTQRKEERNRKVIEGINNFVNSDYDILLIKGQYTDFENNYRNNLILLVKDYPELEKEIYYINVEDPNVLYDRMIQEEWFQENYEENIEKYTRNWMPISMRYLKERIYEYAELGYSIKEIDNSDGYRFEKVKKLKK